MSKDIWIQGIGWAGMIMFLISYQIKSNKKLYMFQSFGAGLFCMQFCLMGAFSGCFSLLLILIRGIMLKGYHQHKWIKWRGWIAIFCGAFVLIAILTWNGPVSLLALAASVISTIFYWSNNAGKIRLANLCYCSPCWIIYDVIVGSWGGVASEGLTMVSIFVSVLRFGWSTMLDQESDFQN